MEILYFLETNTLLKLQVNKSENKNVLLLWEEDYLLSMKGGFLKINNLVSQIFVTNIFANLQFGSRHFGNLTIW